MSRPKHKSKSRVRHERSAGVIVFREAAGRRLFLLLDYGRHWDYAKGHVEKGEDDRAAALRELDEETGIRDARILDGFAEEIVYYFRKAKGKLVRKTVVFFLATSDTQEVRLSEEHVGSDWLPADEALARLTYPTAKKVLQAALTFLESGSG